LVKIFFSFSFSLQFSWLLGSSFLCLFALPLCLFASLPLCSAFAQPLLLQPLPLNSLASAFALLPYPREEEGREGEALNLQKLKEFV